jgi:hypothetical protein
MTQAPMPVGRASQARLHACVDGARLVDVSFILSIRQKGAIMRRAKGLIGLIGINIMFLCLAVSQLIGKSEKVRFHDFVQIAASGVMCGAALVGIVVCCLIYSGKLRPADRKPAEQQTPLAAKSREDLSNG